LEAPSKRSAAERAETGHQALLKVASNCGARSCSHKPGGHCLAPQRCDDTARAGQHEVQADTRNEGEELLEEARFGEPGIGVGREVAAEPLCETAQAIDLVRGHVDQHRVFVAPILLKLLGSLLRLVDLVL
jgi:hypothetical protein